MLKRVFIEVVFVVAVILGTVAMLNLSSVPAGSIPHSLLWVMDHNLTLLRYLCNGLSPKYGEWAEFTIRFGGGADKVMLEAELILAARALLGLVLPFARLLWWLLVLIVTKPALARVTAHTHS